MVAVLLLGCPPTTFKLAAGQPGGMYAAFASSLKDALRPRASRSRSSRPPAPSRTPSSCARATPTSGSSRAEPSSSPTSAGRPRCRRCSTNPSTFARQGAIDVVDGIPILAGKRLAIGPSGSGTNATARALIDQTGSTAVALEWTTDEAIEGLSAGTIDAAFFVVAANVSLYRGAGGDPCTEALPARSGGPRTLAAVPVARGTLRGTLDPDTSPVPPRGHGHVAAASRSWARGLEPRPGPARRARGCQQSCWSPTSATSTPSPRCNDTRLRVNEDAKKYLDEGPTPLESFLPFDGTASPCRRIHLILLPLLVLVFPV